MNPQNQVPIVAVTGGGTGGHVYPALSVIAELRRICGSRRVSEFVWIGSKDGVERSIVAQNKLEYRSIAVGKLRRYFSLKNLFDMFRIGIGLIQSMFLLIRLRPAILFSKGGYVSVPPVIAAGILGIPVFCHDSDFDPGLATRIAARFAERILVGYEESRRYFNRAVQSRVFVSGIPIRKEVMAGDAEKGRQYLGFENNNPVMLVLGGSQGARRINELIADTRSELRKRWNIVHQTGDAWDADRTADPAADGYISFRYLRDEYADVLAAAEVVVCRAGATTLWELAALGKTALLLPIGRDASRGDQIRNAEFFRSNEAALVIEGPRYDREDFLGVVDSLARDEERRKTFGRNARELITIDGAEKIAKLICNRIYRFEDVR